MSGCPEMTGPGLRFVISRLLLNLFVCVIFLLHIYAHFLLSVLFRTYLWFDEKGKKTRVAAPQYIDYVMTFTQKTISDESIFPTKYGSYFPLFWYDFMSFVMNQIFIFLCSIFFSQ